MGHKVRVRQYITIRVALGKMSEWCLTNDVWRDVARRNEYFSGMVRLAKQLAKQ
jgi:hypothetical protein